MRLARAWAQTLGLLIVSATAIAQVRPRSAAGRLRLDPDIASIATDAYVFGYPLVSMDLSRRVMTNVPTPGQGRAPIDQVAALYAYPTAAYKDVVAPNVNTLYNSIWLDLSKGPIVVHMPDTHGRYYVMEILDAWTNVISAPGKRTTGTAAQDILVAGPGWAGTAPSGITTTVKSPTNMVWVINRIQANGPRDYPIVNPLQQAITTKPLASYGKSFAWPGGTIDPSVDMRTAVLTQVNRMSGAEFFTAMARAMKANPPAAADAEIVARMARIGLRHGEFKLDPAQAAAIEAGANAGLAKIQSSVASVSRVNNGWASIGDCGQYGTKYLMRAVVAFKGLGCNLPDDALYPMTSTDSEGQKLNGAHDYVVHFAPGQEPPTKAFWSITMYDAQNFLVDNPINRYAVSSWMPLRKSSDGSTDIYVQQLPPVAAKGTNWLPAPRGDFVLMLRDYWPGRGMIEGTWKPPAVMKVR